MVLAQRQEEILSQDQSDTGTKMLAINIIIPSLGQDCVIEPVLCGSGPLYETMLTKVDVGDVMLVIPTKTASPVYQVVEYFIVVLIQVSV